MLHTLSHLVSRVHGLQGGFNRYSKWAAGQLPVALRSSLEKVSRSCHSRETRGATDVLRHSLLALSHLGLQVVGGGLNLLVPRASPSHLQSVSDVQGAHALSLAVGESSEAHRSATHNLGHVRSPSSELPCPDSRQKCFQGRMLLLDTCATHRHTPATLEPGTSKS